MFDHLKPSNYGAETAVDVGIFIAGAAVGGIADAVVNFAGFAEPLVISGFTGAGALGLKKLLWDAPRHSFKPSDRDTALEEIRLEIELMSSSASMEDDTRRRRFYDLAKQSRLDAEAIRRLWIQNR